MGILSLTTPQDLLTKCKKEMSSFSPVEFNDYQLFNVIFSLNHLYEWAYKDEAMDSQKAKKIAEHFFPFDEFSHCHCDILKGIISHTVKTNPNQKAIRLLSNKQKHVNVKTNTPPLSQTKIPTAVAGRMCAGGVNSYAGYSKFIYEIKLGNNTVDLVDLINSLINDWEQHLS